MPTRCATAGRARAAVPCRDRTRGRVAATGGRRGPAQVFFFFQGGGAGEACVGRQNRGRTICSLICSLQPPCLLGQKGGPAGNSPAPNPHAPLDLTLVRADAPSGPLRPFRCDGGRRSAGPDHCRELPGALRLRILQRHQVPPQHQGLHAPGKFRAAPATKEMACRWIVQVFIISLVPRCERRAIASFEGLSPSARCLLPPLRPHMLPSPFIPPPVSPAVP